MAAALPNSLVLPNNQLLSGSSMKSLDRCLTKLPFGQNHVGNVYFRTSKRTLSFQANCRSGDTGLFVGGFFLGGLVVSAVGVILAPQIRDALQEAHKLAWIRQMRPDTDDEQDLAEVDARLEDWYYATARGSLRPKRKKKKKRPEDEEWLPIC